MSTDLDDTLASDAAMPAHRRPRIFIVYENHEQYVAQALQDLLNTWGFDAFFCRQEIRVLATSEGYRQELAENLANADLVILILSNGFQHSPYCQAEAGATVTLKKHQIHITIPPVAADDIKRISPVLEGWELIDGSMPEEVARVLRNRLRGVFKDPGILEPKNAEIELNCGAAKKLRESLDDVIREYKIEPPEQAQIGVWESLTDPRASASIIAHIRRAIADGETNVAVVGVSLKYSIHIITQAINSLAAEGSTSWRGPLTIELVHVDDQSHILHTLKDDIDISSVLRYFRIGWEQTKADWMENVRM
jgi:TIR domain